MKLLKEQIVGPSDLSFYYTKFRDSPATIRSIKIPLMEPCLTKEERDKFSFFTTPLLSLYGIYIHKPSKLIIVYCKDKKSFAIRKDKYELQDIINRSLRNEILSNNEAILGVHYIDPKEFENSFDDRNKADKEDNREFSTFTQRIQEDNENNIYGDHTNIDNDDNQENNDNDDNQENNDNDDNEDNNNDNHDNNNDNHNNDNHNHDNNNDNRDNNNDNHDNNTNGGNYSKFNNDNNNNIDSIDDDDNNDNDNNDNNENGIDVITGNDLIEDIERYKSQLGFEIPYEVEESELKNEIIPLLPIYFGYNDLKDFNKIKPVDFSNKLSKLFLKNSINNFLLYQTIYCSQEQIRLKIELNKKYKIEIIMSYFITNFDLKISRKSFLASFFSLIEKFDEFEEIESGGRFVDMYNEKEIHNHPIQNRDPQISLEKNHELDQNTVNCESNISRDEVRNQGKKEQGESVSEQFEFREEQTAYVNEENKGNEEESKDLKEQTEDDYKQEVVANESAEEMNEDKQEYIDKEEVNKNKENVNEEQDISEEEDKKEGQENEEKAMNKQERKGQEAVNENRTKSPEPILDLEDFYNILENIHDSQETNESPGNKEKLNEDVNYEREPNEDLNNEQKLNEYLSNEQKEGNEDLNSKQKELTQVLNNEQKEPQSASNKRPNAPRVYSEIKKKVTKKDPVTVSRRVLPRKVKKKPVVVTKNESQSENIIEMEYDMDFENGRNKRQRRSTSGSHKNNSTVNGLKPYACKKCGLSFHLQQTAKNHVATSHKKGTIIVRKGRNPIDDSMIKANISDMEVDIPKSPAAAASNKNQTASTSSITGIKNSKTNSSDAIASSNSESDFFLQELMSSNREESDQEYQSQKGGKIFSAIE